MPPVPGLTKQTPPCHNQWGELDENPIEGQVHVRHQISAARDTGYMFGKNFWSLREALSFAAAMDTAGLRADVIVQAGPEYWTGVSRSNQGGRYVPDHEAVGRHWAAARDGRRRLPPEAPFQLRVADQLRYICDDVHDYSDLTERRDRFLEEAIELGQSLEMTEDEAMQLVRYVFSREKGEPRQEFGGAMTTLAGLAQFAQVDLNECGEAELERCWKPEIVEKIRGKRSRRHGRGPLPGTTGTGAAPEASEASPPALASTTLTLPHPLMGGQEYPASVVLSDLAGQEGCDGDPYDTMQILADRLRRSGTCEDRLRGILEDYFYVEWGDKIHLWEELASAAIKSSESQQEIDLPVWRGGKAAPHATVAVPLSIVTALRDAQIGDLWVDGATADLYTSVPGSTYAGHASIVAKFSTGPLFLKRATAFAMVVNWIQTLDAKADPVAPDPKTPASELGTLPPAFRAVAIENWGESWVANEESLLLDLARSVAPPAPEPAPLTDEICRVLRDARGFVAALRGTDHGLFKRIDALLPPPYGSAPLIDAPPNLTEPGAPIPMVEGTVRIGESGIADLPSHEPWTTARVRELEHTLSDTEILAHIRGHGFTVAVHNDYRLSKVPNTFWLFTHPSGVWVKGEGLSDRIALLAVLYQILEAAERPATGTCYSTWLNQTVPEDVLFPGIKFGRGVTLNTIINAAHRWKTQLDECLAAQLAVPEPASVAEVEGWDALSPREIVRRTRAEAVPFGGIGGTLDKRTWRAACDTIISRLPDGDRLPEWPVPYQQTFNAISSAVRIPGTYSMAISVQGFVKSLTDAGHFAPPSSDWSMGRKD